MYMLHTTALWKQVFLGWAQVGRQKKKMQKWASHIHAVYVGVSTDGREGPLAPHSKNDGVCLRTSPRLCPFTTCTGSRPPNFLVPFDSSLQ